MVMPVDEDSELIGAVYHDFVHRMAVLVAATEASGMLITELEPAVSFQPVVHIRPGKVDTAVRDAAVKAFKEIAIPCITGRKDGAIEVQ